MHTALLAGIELIIAGHESIDNENDIHDGIHLKTMEVTVAEMNIR